VIRPLPRLQGRGRPLLIPSRARPLHAGSTPGGPTAVTLRTVVRANSIFRATPDLRRVCEACTKAQVTPRPRLPPDQRTNGRTGSRPSWLTPPWSHATAAAATTRP